MKNLIIATTIMMLVFIGCKQIDDAIADDYYMTCKIDGQDWKASFKKGLGEQGTRAELYKGSSVLGIIGKNDLSELFLVLVGIDSIPWKTYTLEKAPNSNAYYYLNPFGPTIRTNNLNTGMCSLTEFNKTNMTVAGSFYFQVFDSVNQKLITISDGKFRMKL